LLDRLVGAAAIDAEEYRRSFELDLYWLLNARADRPAKAGERDPFADYPHVRRSVLNLGLPDLVGKALTEEDVDRLRSRLLEVLVNFEPRLVRDSLRLRVDAAPDSSHKPLNFELEGELLMVRVHEEMRVRIVFDLGTGHCEVENP